MFSNDDLFVSCSAMIDLYAEFTAFSPRNALRMLRALDDAIVRAHDMEQLKVNVPLTDATLGDLVSFGSIFSNKLLEGMYVGSLQNE